MASLLKSGRGRRFPLGSHPDNGGVNCPAAEIPLRSLVSQLIDFPFNDAAPSATVTESIIAANHVALWPRGFDPGGRAGGDAARDRRQALFLFSIQETIDQFFIRKNRKGRVRQARQARGLEGW